MENKIYFIFLFLFACQSTPKVDSVGSGLQTSAALSAKAPTQDPETESAEKIQSEFLAGRCQSVLEKTPVFYKKFPYSRVTQNLKLIQAECELQSENFEQAVLILKDVSGQNFGSSAQFAAQAYLLLSYAYEGLGQTEKSLSAVLDAERLGNQLSQAARLAEVPARLSLIYSKMSDLKQAGLYIARVEEGLRVLKSSNPQFLGSSFWAKIYYSMGYIDLNQIYLESISESIQGMMAVQKYSLKSLEFGEPVWSDKALQLLEKNYQTLWAIIQSEPPPQSKYNSGDMQQIKDQRLAWLYELNDLVRQAMLYRPLENQPQSVMSIRFYEGLDAYQIKINQSIEKNFRKTRLTEESIRLNSPLKPGRVYPTQFFPNEMTHPNHGEEK